MTPRVAVGELEVDGRQLTVRDLDRVVFPGTGTTRQQLLDYYDAVAGVLLPHLHDRVLHMPRYPAGVEGPCWTRACPRLRPAWVPTTSVWDPGRGQPVEYCMANERAALLWAVGVGSIELYTSLHRCGAPRHPTAMAFCLEPCEGVTLLDCCQTALALRELLVAGGLASYVKTSGAKGLHVLVPLGGLSDYAATRARARELAETLEQHMPDAVIACGEPRSRHKVLADYRANNEHETIICPYAVRAQERPTVSTPVTWDEVQAALDAGEEARLIFEPAQVLQRVADQGDPFAGVLAGGQELDIALPGA